MNSVTKFLPLSKITTAAEVDHQLELVQQETRRVTNSCAILVHQNRMTPSLQAEFQAQLRSLESRRQKYLNRKRQLQPTGD
ncbi:hypothetical protein IWQ60_006852, partial [Tieghemiomyces parasiticus]